MAGGWGEMEREDEKSKRKRRRNIGKRDEDGELAYHVM